MLSRAACIRLLCLATTIVLGFISLTIFYGPNQFQKQYYPLYYNNEIQAAALRHSISPYLICAVIKSESDWDPYAQSHVGAQGLMQLMPKTAEDIANMGLVNDERYRPDNLYDTETNIEYGAAYLRYLVNRYHEIEPVIAAYNAGLGNVDKWQKEGRDIRATIQFPETEKYLIKVVRAKEAYEHLYPGAFVKPLPPGQIRE